MCTLLIRNVRDVHHALVPLINKVRTEGDTTLRTWPCT